MSDFTSSGWSIYIGALTIVGLLGCLWLLIIASKRTVMAGDNSTGHVFDGDIKEMNNPLPLWWMVLFIITVVFSFAYLWFFPGLGSAPGSLGWSSEQQFRDEEAAARQQITAVYARFKPMSAEELSRDASAMAIGERLFINTCATCHGSDARGSKSFPDLTQPASARLAAATPEAIRDIIVNGRTGMMPPMGAAVGNADDVRNVANYVLSLAGSPHDNVAAQLGAAKFAACAACHGNKGQGNQALGAPRLADKYWLHGWGEQAIIQTVTQGRTNVMPPQGARFTPEQLQVLTAYVWKLSQSQVNPAGATKP